MKWKQLRALIKSNLCPVKLGSRNSPASKAVLTDQGDLTYAEFDRSIDDLAAKIAPLSSTPAPESQARFIIDSSPSLKAVRSILALLRLGAVPVIIDSRFPTTQLISRWLGEASPLQSEKTYPIFPESTILEYVDSPPVVLSSKKDAAIIFSSGSSGEPKGIIHTRHGLFAQAYRSNKEVTELSSNDCWLLSLYPCHAGGLQIIFRTFLTGASLAIPSSFCPSVLATWLNSGLITGASLVPDQLRQIILKSSAKKFSEKLRFILLGGAPLLPNDYETFLGATHGKLIFSYGLSETASHIAYSFKPLAPKKILKGISVKIDINDSDNTASKDSGKICIKSSTLARAYLSSQGEESLADLFGYFTTNDLGRLDNHDLIFEQRADRMIISGGKKLNPEKLAEPFSSLNGVKSAVALGFPHPKWTARPILFLEASQKEAWKEIKKEADKINKKRHRLEQAEMIFILDELPRTIIGKICFRSLRKQFETEVNLLFRKVHGELVR